MKIISYNVNGLRSAIQKGFVEWLQATQADVVCLQEIKATPDQIPLALFEDMGYHLYWYPAETKGYSGVAIFTKKIPVHIEYGINILKYDAEGRSLRIDFEDYSILNVYMPSGSSGEHRQGFKFEWMKDFEVYLLDLIQKIPNLVVVGDFNICHRPIDIHNPVSNAKSSGFLPEERLWLDTFFQSAFIDTFRHFNPEPHHYTWWSYRAGSRGKNLGWRIDYQMVTKSLESRLSRAAILPEARHSDHCPTLLEIL